MTDKVEGNKEEDQVEDKQPEGDEEEAPALSPLEQQAHGFGWLPKEEWVKAGHSEDDWAPAKHFMKFGELKKQVIEKDKALQKQERLFKVVKDHHLNVKQAAYNEALKTLKAERMAALESNDLTKAEFIKDQMEETKEKFEKEKALPPELEQELRNPPQQQQQTPPEFYDFLERNPWYDGKNELSREADKLGVGEAHMRQARGQKVDPGEIYAIVEKQIRKLYPEKFEKQKSPQSTGSQQSGTSGGSKTRLSEEELSIAKTFGLTPEQYAAEQKKYRGR